MGYANFFQRLGAFVIDNLILSAVLLPFLMLAQGGTSGGRGGRNIIFLLYLLIGWLYYAVQESSEKQATIGKRALSIKVTDFNGNRLTFGNATGRFFGKLVSGMIYGIGFLMAAFTKQRQALHDKMANTFVVTLATDQSFFAGESSSRNIKDGIENKLTQLAELKDKGILSPQEFEEAKSKLLARV